MVRKNLSLVHICTRWVNFNHARSPDNHFQSFLGLSKASSLLRGKKSFSRGSWERSGQRPNADSQRQP